jgi:hypothetical protein
MVVWEVEPMVYMCQSLGGSCSGALWTGDVVEPKKPWVSFGWPVLTHRVSGYVGLDRPPPVASSGVFLVARDVGSRG